MVICPDTGRYGRERAEKKDDAALLQNSDPRK